MITLWLTLTVWSGLAGYTIGGWWATRLTRAERRLADRYLYYPTVVNTRAPGSRP